MYFSKRFYAGHWLLSSFLMVMVLVACSPFPTHQSSSTKQSMSKSAPTVALGAPHCQPPSPITASKVGIPEVRGTTDGKTELWGLLFGGMVARQELKIVWRMTGNGDIQIAAHGPHGEFVKAKWITYHGASNWARPGLEWGTGFILPEPGCWNFSVRRDDASGNVWFLVK